MAINGEDSTKRMTMAMILPVNVLCIDTVLQSDGLIEVELNNNDALTGNVDLYLKAGETTPTKGFAVQIGNLDPIDTLSGVQGRCNMLGFNCGKVDGVMGEKTRIGVKEFQYEHDLDIDGIPGPKTKAKLQQVFGS